MDDRDSSSSLSAHLQSLVQPWLFILCNLLLCESCQAVSPAHLPYLYLTDNCEKADLQGVRRVTIHTQRDTLYENNMDCWLILSTRSTYVMSFHFEHLDLPEPTGSLCEDYVQLFNGNSEELSLTQPICGSNHPPVFLSNSSLVALKFRTSPKNQRTGFRLVVERLAQTEGDRIGCLKDQEAGCQVLTTSPPSSEEETPSEVDTAYSWTVVIIGLLATWSLVMYTLILR